MSRTRAPKVWTCQRTIKGVKCGAKNPKRLRLCFACRNPKPKKRKPLHMVALELTYEAYILLNGGERCGICGRPPMSRKLDRDHDHKTHKPRGLLCHRCNRALPSWMTAEWCDAAAAYLRKAETIAAQQVPDTGHPN